MSWRVERDVDEAAAYAAFATDRRWCGYAIADLEPPFRAYGRVDVARRGDAVAAVLLFRHPAFTSVVPHGDPAGLAAILAGMELPARTHLFARDEQLPTLRRFFDYPDPTPMVRMAVDRAGFRPLGGPAVRLGEADAAALTDLYQGYPESAFQPDQLATGVFRGVREGGRLLAAAGTHVVSRRYGIAAVGNIYTRPEARGRGLAAAVTAAVVRELLANGIEEAILNVALANEPARRVYARLGFVDHCPHYEGMATSPNEPSPLGSSRVSTGIPSKPTFPGLP